MLKQIIILMFSCSHGTLYQISGYNSTMNGKTCLFLNFGTINELLTYIDFMLLLLYMDVPNVRYRNKDC